MARKPLPFVVVDTSEEKLQKYASEGWLTLVGDATQAAVLQQLRIEHAQGLVAATTTDAINIYIILTARSLNPKIKIIARALGRRCRKALADRRARIRWSRPIGSPDIASRRRSCDPTWSISSTPP